MDGLLAFLAKGAKPQQDINVAKAAINPLILPMLKYPTSFLDKMFAAIIRPLSPARIEPVNLAAFNLVRTLMSFESSVDNAAKGRFTLV